MAINAQFLFPNDKVTPLGKFRHVFNSRTSYTLNYSRWLGVGETVVGVAYSVFPATTPALAVVDSAIVASGKNVTFDLSGGLERSEYQVQIVATTSTGQVKTDIILASVPSFLAQDSGAVPQVPPGSADVVAQLLTSASAAATSAASASTSAGQAATSATNAQASANSAASAVAGVPAQLATKANLASPTFTGTPAAPTPAGADNTTKLATTAFVQSAISAKANLASPTFTGTPAAPTPPADDNTTKIATTAYVQSELTALSAANLNTGIIPDARMPSLTGDVTTVEGAVAATIANGAVSLAKMANLAANSILGNNTGAPTTPIALTKAQAKELLQIDRGAAITTGSGTEHDFTSIPAWVRRITVMLNAVSLSGTDHLLMQLGDSGGIEATGYSSKAVQTEPPSTLTEYSSSAGVIVPLGGAAETIAAVITLVNIAANVWLVSGKAYYASGDIVAIFATKTLSAQLDRIRLTRTGANNFDGGTFNILYE